MARRACLTGFVVIAGVPEPTKAEFWDMRHGTLLVEHLVPPTNGRMYQFYFPDDYFVDDVEDVQCLWSDELPNQTEVILRWGDRNPMRVW